MRLIRLSLLLVCLQFGSGLVFAQAQTKVRLVLSAESARPGDTVWGGVELRMPPKWHTYWRYSGDSGLPTSIQWQLPAGISAGEIHWPPPEKYTAADLVTYVYHDEVMLLVPLTLAGNLAAGPVSLKAAVSWLECDETCLPGRTDVTATLQVGTELKPSQDAGLIDAWTKKLPGKDPALAVRAHWEKSSSNESRSLILEWEGQSRPEVADFFPYPSEDVEIGGATERLNREGGTVALRKTVKKLGDNWPSRVTGLTVAKLTGTAPLQAHEVEVVLAPNETNTSVASAPSNGGPTAKKSLVKMLLLAFLGGLILNIMPCVLPVIALKILGFVQQSQEDPRRVRQLGLVYGAGVLVSFLVLAGIVIAVQQAGQVADWGMQFQNPQFVVAMTVLVTLVALNLFGLFEVTLGGGAMQAATSLAYKEGGAGAFFQGVLATALATPCTAPALATALGFAFTQTPAVILLMFITVGAGLAFPYVVLSWQPGWLKFLPRPGMWMEKFKIAMGFPMLATAFWLLWLTTAHFGRDGTLWVGIFLATVSMAAWIWGDFVQRGRKARGLAMALSVGLVAAAYVYVLEGQLRWRSPAPPAKTGELALNHPDGIPWKAWTAKAVEEARAAGHPVLVDFTADWCVTCQWNKKTSLEVPSVRARLKEIDAVAFLGDYTNRDPAITEQLRRYERAGVPLVLIYPADPNASADVLPALLTPGTVLDALNKVASPKVASREETRGVR